MIILHIEQISKTFTLGIPERLKHDGKILTPTLFYDKGVAMLSVDFPLPLVIPLFKISLFVYRKSRLQFYHWNL